METRTLNMATQFRANENNGKKYIEGYFAVFDDVYEIWDDMTESVDRHAFDESVDGDIRALVNHDTTLVLGRSKAGTAEFRVDDHGLWGSVEINPNDTDATNTWERVKRGDVNQATFGFEIISETSTRNGDKIHFTLMKVKLHEVSVCTFPAYNSTELSARGADEKHIKKSRFELWNSQQDERMNKWL